jgi:hypothetical protein
MHDLIQTLNQLQHNINQTQVALQEAIDRLNEEAVPEVLPYVTETVTNDLRAFAYFPILRLTTTSVSGVLCKEWETRKSVRLGGTVFLTKNGLLTLARRVELETTFLYKSNHGLETIAKFRATQLEERKLGVVKRAWNNTDAGMMIDGEKVLPFWFDKNVLTLANFWQRNNHGALFRLPATDVYSDTSADALDVDHLDYRTVLSAGISARNDGNIDVYTHA